MSIINQFAGMQGGFPQQCGMKRTAPGAPGFQCGPHAEKIPRTDDPKLANEDGAWACDKCGNVNFKGRTFCNMRKCGAPGPWTCLACGNENYAGRESCNRRTCNQPRPPNPCAPGGAC